MILYRRPALSLSLLLLAACGPKDPGATASSGDSETGPGVTTTGLSMSSNPTSEDPTTGGGASVPGDPTNDTTTDATTTGVDPSDPTTGVDPSATTTGPPVECEIEQPRPGSCDAGAPKQPSVRFAGQLAPRAGVKGPAGPKQVADGDDEQFATTGCSFICEPDMGGPVIECDVFAQDCGPGEKCNAWANDGGSSWNATKCVPVARDPDLIGEPCTVDGSSVSGIDSCAKGAMCLGTGENDQGTCVEVCSCSAANPVCTTPNTACTITNDDVLALCLPVCDPLDANACSAGDVCLNTGSSEFFICVLDASGDFGEIGAPCEFINACDPGLACAANTGQFPDCGPGAFGCCSPFCDLTEPVCPGGLTCTPWYEQGTAPKCFEDVGVCL